jgi:hypothetical protein
MKSKMYKITPSELRDEPFYWTSEQTILGILKEQGAPVKGYFWLKPDLDNYVWTRTEGVITGNLYFEVAERFSSETPSLP